MAAEGRHMIMKIEQLWFAVVVYTYLPTAQVIQDMSCSCELFATFLKAGVILAGLCYDRA